jgi:hypothetical protein
LPTESVRPSHLALQPFALNSPPKTSAAASITQTVMILVKTAPVRVFIDKPFRGDIRRIKRLQTKKEAHLSLLLLERCAGRSVADKMRVPLEPTAFYARRQGRERARRFSSQKAKRRVKGALTAAFTPPRTRASI